MANIKFDKEIILSKSLEIAVEQGFSEISVRNVAKKVAALQRQYILHLKM